VKRFILLRYAAATLVALLLSYCGALAQQYSLRPVNLLSGPDSIDVYLNNNTPATFGGLPYEYAGALAKKLTVGTGALNLKVTEAGAGIGTPLLSRDVTVAGATDYTAVAYGSKTAPKFKLLSRLLSQVPAPDKSLLRIMHAASVTGGFDIYMNANSGTPFISNLAPDSATNFTQVDKRVDTIFIMEAGKPTPLAVVIASMTPSSADLGARITLFITGSKATGLKVYLMHGEDEERYQMPTLAQTGTLLPSLRAVHAWPTKSLSVLDVYLDNTRKTKKVVYRGATDSYEGLTQDSATLAFTPVDLGVSNAELTRGVKLSMDTGYTVILTEFKDESPTSMLLTRFLAEPVAGVLKVRLANASDFFGNISITLKADNGDTVHFDNVQFLTSTGWREITAGNLHLEAFRAGETTPFYTGSYVASDNKLLTLVALGDASTSSSQFAVDVLDEGVISVLPRMGSFSGPVESVDQPLAEGSRTLRLTNAPNPFAGSTRLSLFLPERGRLQVSLYDGLGRRVGTPYDRWTEAGDQAITIDGAGLSSGVYTCVVQAGDTRAARQITVMR
jgi:hypothetical protein